MVEKLYIISEYFSVKELYLSIHNTVIMFIKTVSGSNKKYNAAITMIIEYLINVKTML